MVVLASVLETDGYVVGSNNGPSGLHYFDGHTWQHTGWRNVRAFSVAVDPTSEDVLLACGNGLLRRRYGAAKQQQGWRVESDWRVAEALDVLPNWRGGETLLATGHGVWTWDGQLSWSRLNEGLATTFVSALFPMDSGNVLGATELGVAIYRQKTRKWTHVGPGLPTRTVACWDNDTKWIAGSDRSGVQISTDAGSSWRRPSARSGSGAHFERDSIYATAVHPSGTGTLAAGGLSGTVWWSEDHGSTWREAATTHGHDAIHSLAFDPLTDLVYCGCGKSGLHVVNPNKGTTEQRALDRAFISRIVFVSEFEL